MRIEDFKKKDEKEVFLVKEDFPVLQYKSLREIPFINHCFTTREGGVSEDIFATLNLSFTRGDDKDAVLENYRRVAKSLERTIDDFVCSDQTHTTNVLRVGKKEAGFGVTKERPYTDIDGLITNEPGVILSTFYADCVPLFFVDRVHKAIGLSHSGWRGTVGRMGQKTLLAMEKEFGTKPSDVIVAVGPSICQDCYEISEDVAVEFQKEFQGHEKEILISKGNGKYHLDLWKTNEIIFREAGVSDENIIVTNICTCCNPKLLFSHRASKGKRGNLGAFLSINE